MPFTHLIAFDRPLASAVLPGRSGRMFTEAEVSAQMHEAYRNGEMAARASADQQMVEARTGLAELSEQVLKKVAVIEPALVAQLQDALPGLAVEIARRLLAGYEPSAQIVEQLCRDALEQLFPEQEGLELRLSPRDADLLQSLNPDWLARYPGIRIRSDAGLVPGDCMVRSRFGLTDARQATKLSALSQTLTGK
jgi:flagellar assembly protein FliH